MRNIRWRDHETCFNSVLDTIRDGYRENLFDIPSALKNCTKNNPLADQVILGVPSYSISFLEFLFHKAQGPYSPNFEWIAVIIQNFFLRSPELQTLINLNAADALANMVLNKRGKLKFLISDQFELRIILEWWVRFGLTLVSPGEVFEAVLTKPTIKDRLIQGDPLLIMRLTDVFPEYAEIINAQGMSRSELVKRAGMITMPPSERRYHQLFKSYINDGRNIWSVISDEEKRILPMQMKRNRFLAYLVKKMHNSTCQICAVRGDETTGPVEVHHIIPLSTEGKDIADNMLVTCTFHHQAIHAGKITMNILEDSVQINCADGKWTIPINSKEFPSLKEKFQII